MSSRKKNSHTESKFVKVYEGIFPETVCSLLKDAVDEQNERIENDRRPNFYQRNVGRDPQYTGLYNTFKQLGKRYFSDLGYEDDLLPSKYGFEELRIKKYDVGDSFDKHIDVADHASARRWLAFLVYLNDDFRGGETQFHMQSKIIKPKTGSVLIFPPTWNFPHAGLPVIMGTKYILTTYFHFL